MDLNSEVLEPRVIDRRWQIDAEIPSKRGGNGRVSAATDILKEHNGLLAVKEILKTDSISLDRFKREVQAMSELFQLKKSRFVPVLFANLDPETNQVKAYYVMPYYRNGCVKYNPSMSPGNLLSSIITVVQAMKVIHLRGDAHRDLKPTNILVDNKNQLMIADFGLYLQENEEDRLTPDGKQVASRGYRAPELAGGQACNDYRSADVYALGMTLWTLSSGREPEENMDVSRSEFNLSAIRGAQWSSMQLLVQDMTATQIGDRLTMAQVLDRIKDHTENASGAKVARDKSKRFSRIRELAHTSDTIKRASETECNRQSFDVTRLNLIKKVGQEFGKSTELSDLRNAVDHPGLDLKYSYDSSSACGIHLKMALRSGTPLVSLHVQMIPFNRLGKNGNGVRLKSFVTREKEHIKLGTMDFQILNSEASSKYWQLLREGFSRYQEEVEAVLDEMN